MKAIFPTRLRPRALFSVFALMLTGFAGVILYSETIAARLDADAVSIATDAAAGIEHLAAANDEITRLQEIAAAPGFASDRLEKAAAWRQGLMRLKHELAAYEALPFYPGEDALYAEAARAVAEFEPEIAGRPRADFAQAHGAITRLIRYNTDQQQKLADDIPAIRKHASGVAHWLFLTFAIFGTVLTVMVVRAVRMNARLLEDGKRMAEELALENQSLYKQAQAALRAREEILAVVSHDLKNPLSAIRVAADLMHPLRQEANIAQLATIINTSAERMLRLLNELLDAAKLETGMLQCHPQGEMIAPLVEEAASIFTIVAAEKGIALGYRAIPDDVLVLCERALILRVFSNLLSNALKHTSKHGSVYIDVSLGGAQARFSVRDTGTGILPENLPRVFERFWQQSDTERHGSGLGLYICKGLVEAHGGRIWVKASRAGAPRFSSHCLCPPPQPRSR